MTSEQGPRHWGRGDGPGWFSVRCVFLWHFRTDPYEERITIWRADSGAEAIAKAEKEAEEFAELMEAEYLGLAQGFSVDTQEVITEGTEIYSLCRDSDLDPETYLDTFFDTGREYDRPAVDADTE